MYGFKPDSVPLVQLYEPLTLHQTESNLICYNKHPLYLDVVVEKDKEEGEPKIHAQLPAQRPEGW